jgi:hypothetical protein
MGLCNVPFVIPEEEGRKPRVGQMKEEMKNNRAVK